VAVIASNESKLRQMKEAVSAALGLGMSAGVGYFLPDDFISHLERLAREDAGKAGVPPMETTRRGYKVKRSAPKLTEEERKQKEDAALRIIADNLKSQPPPNES
jgi:hypothetical protein